MKKLLNKKIQFDNYESQKMKGIAIVFMVLLHAIYHAPKDVEVTYAFLPEHIVYNIAGMGKVCVSMFAFVSGYGLWKSYERKKNSSNQWIVGQLFKLLSKFWVVWAVTAIACEILSSRSSQVYLQNGMIDGIKNILIEMLGFADLFHTPSLTSVYWYIGAASFFVLCIPFLHKLRRNLIPVALMTVLLPRIFRGDSGFMGSRNPGSFLFVFVLGVIAAEYGLIEQWVNAFRFQGGRIVKCISEIVLLCICYKVYYFFPIKVYWEIHWGIIPFILIIFCVEFINQIPGLDLILNFLGKHSMNIYLVHSILKNIYLKKYLYFCHNWFLILSALLMISVIISLLIEKMKKVLKFEKCVSAVLKKLA